MAAPDVKSTQPAPDLKACMLLLRVDLSPPRPTDLYLVPTDKDKAMDESHKAQGVLRQKTDQ